MAKKATSTDKRVADTTPKAYELMLILSPQLRETEVKKKLKEITDMVEKASGKVLKEDLWGKRALTYRIRGNTEGFYAVYNFEMPGTLNAELNEHLRIDKEALRHLLITLPAGYEYTKYDLDKKPEPVKKREPKHSAPNVSIKHSGSAKAESTETTTKDKGKEADKAELNKKLDQMIEGGDLNL